MVTPPTPFVGSIRLPWLRPVAQLLRALALLAGVVLATTGAAEPDALDVLAGTALLLWLAWRAVPAVGSRVRLRDTVGAELVLATVLVVATGGWTSPWFLALAVPIGLATLGLSLVRAAALAALAVAVVTIATLPGGFEVGATLQGATTVLVTSAFAAVTRLTLVANAPDHDEALGALDELWSVNALLAGLHQTAAGSGARFSVDDALRTVRDSSQVVGSADLVALVRVEGDGRGELVAGHGVALGPIAVPGRAGTPRRDGQPLVGHAGVDDELLHDAGLVGLLWLPVVASEPPHLLVVAYRGDQDVVADDLTPELLRLAQPLAVTVGNAGWFGRVRHLGVDEERQRIAARLHDSFAQSLAVLAMQLEFAVRRHPDDDELRDLVAQVRGTLAGLRDTMVELRAAVGEERDLALVLGAVVDRVAARPGVVAELHVEDEGPRPPRPVEQQLLRITQELVRRAVDDRGATIVAVRYLVDRERLQLEVLDDGAEPGALGGTDVVRERADAIGASVAQRTTADGRVRARLLLDRAGVVVA